MTSVKVLAVCFFSDSRHPTQAFSRRCSQMPGRMMAAVGRRSKGGCFRTVARSSWTIAAPAWIGDARFGRSVDVLMLDSRPSISVEASTLGFEEFMLLLEPPILDIEVPTLGFEASMLLPEPPADPRHRSADALF